MALSRDEVFTRMVALIREMSQDWDVDEMEMEAATRLGEDLAFASVDALHLMASVDMAFSCRLPYEQLIVRDGQYATDITLGELVDFVQAKMDESPASSEPQKM